MSAPNHSAGKLVKHLLAKNGPMTTQAFYKFVPTYPQEFISKTHLKTKVLKSLEGQGVLFKKVNREAAQQKPVWEWHFTDLSLADKYKNLM